MRLKTGTLPLAEPHTVSVSVSALLPDAALRLSRQMAGQTGEVGRILFGSLVLAAAVACSSSSIEVRPLPAPGTPNSSVLHRATADRRGLTTATVDVTSGATAINIRVAKLGDSLVAASTPAGAGERPTLAVVNRTATVGLVSIGSIGGAPVDLRLGLAAGVRWTVELDGGATSELVDLRGGEVDTVSLGAGATRGVITLPANPGQMMVQETGGLSTLDIVVPHTVSTAVHVGGGASSAQIGRATHTGVAGGTSYQDPGYRSAPRRLAVDLTGGVSNFRLTRP